ncbi:MAG TPA: hypothetical protein VJG90_07795 [Candidatus Nanoarchaeia archaeon]|nr:hypothetical protein [Candidatus Nanoarchaeia archaeon]
MKTIGIIGIIALVLCINLASAYYINPYVKDTTPSPTTTRSIGTQGGFTKVLANRNSLASQISRLYFQRTIQSYKPYSTSELPNIRKAVSNRQYFVAQNEFNQYLNPISYADESLKDKLATALGIRVVYDPAAGKNVLVTRIPTKKLVELLNNPRSRVETFRNNDVDVDAVLESLDLGQGSFVPKNRDDNLKY